MLKCAKKTNGLNEINVSILKCISITCAFGVAGSSVHSLYNHLCLSSVHWTILIGQVSISGVDKVYHLVGPTTIT